MAKRWDRKVPFDSSTGDMLEYSPTDQVWNYSSKMYVPVLWKDNYAFKDTLEYEGYERGRSSCIIKFRCVTVNNRVRMFMTDFDNVVRMMKDGKVTGEWTFAKRGANFGVMLAKG